MLQLDVKRFFHRLSRACNRGSLIRIETLNARFTETRGSLDSFHNLPHPAACSLLDPL